MSKYFVSHSEQQMGPYSMDEIVSLVGQGTLSPMDYIYVPSQEDWVLFIEHPELSERVKQQKPKVSPPPAHPAKAEQPEPTAPEAKIKPQADIEWFVLKGENKFGPFAYLEVVKMLQEKTLYEFDFIWHDALPNWLRIAECKDFSEAQLRDLKNSSASNVKDVFFRRRHKRVQYNGSLLVHDNNKVWKGSGIELSEGGAGVYMENASVVPGQKLYLHFKPGDGVPHFNAVCEVVSKQYTPNVNDPSTPVRYGLKFITVSVDTQKFLKTYTKETKVAA